MRHGGHTFIAKSRQGWAVEAGISFDQCKHAIAMLRSVGLVATEQHKSGGRNITRVRLMGRALALPPTPGVRGVINVLQVRPTERIQQVWHAATTCQALDAALGGWNSL